MKTLSIDMRLAGPADATAVADAHRQTLTGAEEATRAAQVEGNAGPAEDGGDDLRGARQAPRLGSGKPVAGHVAGEVVARHQP